MESLDYSKMEDIDLLNSLQQKLVGFSNTIFQYYPNLNFSEMSEQGGGGNGGSVQNQGIITSLVMGLGVISILAAICYAMTHWTRTARFLNKFPGPRQIPFLGNFPIIMGPFEDLQATIHDALNQYGGTVMRLWLGVRPYLIVADGRIAEKVLSGYTNLEKADTYSAFHRVLNQSLVTSPGPKWRHDRKSLNPAMMGASLNDGFMQIFNEQSRILNEILIETISEDVKKARNFVILFERATLDSVLQAIFGTRLEAQRNPDLLFVEKLRRIVTTTRSKMLRPYLNFPIIWRLFGYGKEEEENITSLMNYSRKLIDEKFKEREETGVVTGEVTRPLLAYLMDGTDDREDISYHLNALMFAGAGPAAYGLNYLLFLLALNPTLQERLLDEVDAVFPGPVDNVTMSDLPELKYMECCIKEALRLFPPVPGWFRKITKDVVLDDGKIIPVGTQVAFLPYEIHRNPEIFPDPECFNPERFNAENKEKIPPGWWVPFSFGPRNCIGYRFGIMQMKVMLVHIFKKFKVQTDSTRDGLRVMYGIVLEPTPEIKLTLIPRV